MANTVKIKVISTTETCMPFIYPFIDTTVGKVYDAQVLSVGEFDPDGDAARFVSLSFMDDAGDWALPRCDFHEGRSYVVVE